MNDLPDVNVWVALSAPDHPFHERANSYWQAEANPRLCFCRTTALGLVRVISSQHTFGGKPLHPREAWAQYRAWGEQPECELVREPASLESVMERWVHAGLATSRNWTDLYLGAFAVAGSLRLVTFDSDLLRLPGLDVLHLTAVSKLTDSAERK